MTTPPEVLLQQLKAALRKGGWKENIPKAEAMKELLKHVEERRAAALKHFLESGEKEEHFHFRDPIQEEVLEVEKLFVEAQRSHAQSQKTEALQRSRAKEAILSSLRKELSPKLITSAAWQRIEALKQQWTDLPDPPAKYYKKQQLTYASLLRQAQEQQHIVRALKSLDKEKNTAKKASLLEQLRALQASTTDTAAYLQAVSLQKQYKKVGPALPEKEESLLSQFDSIYKAIEANYQIVREEEKQQAEEILAARKQLLDELEHCLSGPVPETSAAWQLRSKAVQDLREKWQALPTSLLTSTSQKNCSQRFWQQVKAFYKAKKKTLAATLKTQAEHLKERKVLIEQAEALLQADTLEVEAFFTLQKQWKSAGAVSPKGHQNIHQAWKELQNRFFERRDKLQQSLEQEAQLQYALYESLDKALSALTKRETFSLEELASALDTCPNSTLPGYLHKRWTQRCSLQIASLLHPFFTQEAPPFEELKAHLTSFKRSSGLGSSLKLLSKKKKLQQNYRSLRKEVELLRLNSQRFRIKQSEKNPIQLQISKNISQQETHTQQLEQLIQLYSILLGTEDERSKTSS